MSFDEALEKYGVIEFYYFIEYWCPECEELWLQQDVGYSFKGGWKEINERYEKYGYEFLDALERAGEFSGEGRFFNVCGLDDPAYCSYECEVQHDKRLEGDHKNEK